MTRRTCAAFLFGVVLGLLARRKRKSWPGDPGTTIDGGRWRR